jgi:hypothetical protein
MKKITLFTAVFALALLFGKDVYAGPPFVNLEGVGGVAYNPLAYLADAGSGIDVDGKEIISKPRFGVWYVNLPDSKIDWTSYGLATTLFKRLEVSIGQQAVAWEAHPTFNKANLGAKVALLDENSFDSKFVPAISVGTIHKTTNGKKLDSIGVPLRSSGQDWYAVATKTITQLPLPVIVSGGVLSSQEWVQGVLGFHNKRKSTLFGNIDLVLPKGFVVGYEFKQGEQFNSFKNANYWNAHLAWLVNSNLTVIAAYTDTAKYGGGATRQGLGNGFVLSAQYAF